LPNKNRPRFLHENTLYFLHYINISLKI
jgi:hypothetical protein